MANANKKEAASDGFSPRLQGRGTRLGRLRYPIDNPWHVKENSDWVSREFLDWLFSSLRKNKVMPDAEPLSEMIATFRSLYQNPPEPSYEHQEVKRRTLSQRFLHKYSSKPKDDLYEAKRQRCREHLNRGFNTPIGTKYREFGHNIGRHSEVGIDPREIILDQLGDGLSLMHRKIVRETTKKKVDHNKMNLSSPESIQNFLREVRKRRKAIFSKEKGMAVQAYEHRVRGLIRQSNVILAEGQRQMHKFLHETEHRIISVAEGVSYLNHIKLCRRRRRIEERRGLRCPMYYERMSAQPALSDIEDEEIDIKLDRVSSNNFLDVPDSNISYTSRQLSRRRNKQLFYDKLRNIYLILSIMKNMKHPKPGQENMPLARDILAKLRPDPYSNLVSEKTTRVTKRSSNEAAPKLAKKAVLPPIKSELRDATTEQNLNEKACISEEDETAEIKGIRARIERFSILNDQPALYRVSEPSSVLNSTSMSSTRLTRTKSVRVDADGRSAKPMSFNKVRSQKKMRKNLYRPLSYGQAQIPESEYDLYDPAAITWDEFLKVGSATDDSTSIEKRGKPDLRSGTQASVRTNSFLQRPSMSMMKKSSRVCGSSPAPNQELALPKISTRDNEYLIAERRLRSWSAMNQSADPYTIHGTKNEQLMRSMGLDKKNPIDHIRLNWLKVKQRGNKMLQREIHKLSVEDEIRYHGIRRSKEITDTSHWKHKWALLFKQNKHRAEQDTADTFVECIDVLNDEASQLHLEKSGPITALVMRIKQLCCHDAIRYTTIYRGKTKLQQIMASMPAYELCTLPAQQALQFILVDVLNGETDLFHPMMVNRGLPIHPGIYSAESLNGTGATTVQSQPPRSPINFVKANQTRSTMPPGKVGINRINVMKQLEKQVIYNDY